MQGAFSFSAQAWIRRPLRLAPVLYRPATPPAARPLYCALEDQQRFIVTLHLALRPCALVLPLRAIRQDATFHWRHAAHRL